MQKGLHIVFKQAAYHPDSTLAGDIWHAIEVRIERSRKIALWTYGAVGALSFAALFPMIQLLMSQFTQSGFYDYFSLAFSDGGYVATYWKEFILSLADSLPTTSIILSLLLLCIFFVSTRRAIRRFTTPLITANA